MRDIATVIIGFLLMLIITGFSFETILGALKFLLVMAVASFLFYAGLLWIRARIMTAEQTKMDRD